MTVVKELNITLHVASIGDKYMAVTVLGGITIRAGRGNTEADACRNVLQMIGGALNEDAAMGLELALQGQTIDQVINPDRELGTGN